MGLFLTPGTLYAGDGLVVEILQPSVSDLRGRPISIFRNRKGIWGVVAQAFCDAYTRFAMFDIKWPGGTNDIVAYAMSTLYNLATSGFFSDWATFVCDEAYSSIGGVHLTPFSIHQLKRAKASSDDSTYFKMLAFNNVLSSQRITIERAFGILIRRWGILWRPIEFELRKVAKKVRVCAMLHNICVDRWLINRARNRHVGDFDTPSQVDLDDELSPSDQAIIDRLHNDHSFQKKRAADCSLRTTLMQDIYDAGIRTTCDTEFNQIPL